MVRGSRSFSESTVRQIKETSSQGLCMMCLNEILFIRVLSGRWLAAAPRWLSIMVGYWTFQYMGAVLLTLVGLVKGSQLTFAACF